MSLRAVGSWIADAWWLGRPALLPFVLMLVGLGFGLAHWDRALPLRGMPALAAVLIGWSLLHAGTLWLNALRDQDTGPVLLGRPVRPPSGLGAWALGALSLAVGVVAVGAPGAPALLAAGCAALALLYSHPATAWKGRSLLGPSVNVLGYGLFTPSAGYAVVGAPWTPRAAAMVGLVGVGVLGCYFLAQVFQEEDDRRRGDRTVVVTHGVTVTVDLARACFAVVFLMMSVLVVVGWLPRVCAVGACAWWPVEGLLRHMRRQVDGGGPGAVVRVAGRLVIAAATLLALAFGDYVWGSVTGGPVAGLATRSGHPPGPPTGPPPDHRTGMSWEVHTGPQLR